MQTYHKYQVDNYSINISKDSPIMTHTTEVSHESESPPD